MKRVPTIPLLFGLACLALSLALACGGSEGLIPAGKARLALELVDAPTHNLKQINVTVAKVTAHSVEAGWVTIYQGQQTIDLLKLKEYALQLGFKDLPPGKVTQIRLILDAAATNHVVLPSGQKVPLKVPSGIESGIKIRGPFGLKACNTTTVTLDFDGPKSIWVHPTGQEELWILRPVIHARRVSTNSTSCAPPDGSGGGSGSPTLPPEGPGGVGTGGGSGSGSGGGSGSGLPGGILEGAGGACTTGTSCLSGVCNNGVCGQGGPGVPCRNPTDCASGQCQSDGTCGAGAAGGAGSACTVGSQCLSNACVNGFCEAGSQGAPSAAVAPARPTIQTG